MKTWLRVCESCRWNQAEMISFGDEGDRACFSATCPPTIAAFAGGGNSSEQLPTTLATADSDTRIGRYGGPVAVVQVAISCRADQEKSCIR